MATAMRLERQNNMADELDEIKAQLAEVRGDVKAIRVLLDTEGQRCAFREKIAEATNIIPRVWKLEDRLVQMEIKVAGIAVIAAIITALITTLVTGALTP